jgi:hypothetical protein
MKKEEKALAALKAKGVSVSAKKWETISTKLVENGLNPDNFTDDEVISDELLKTIANLGGVAFNSDELQQQLKKDKENEFPDYGRDIPDGEYVVTGYTTVKDWKNPRTGNISHIRTAFIKNDDDEVFQLPYASFCAKEWDFISYAGKDSDGKATYEKAEMHCILPFISSVADRNLTVSNTMKAGDRIKVCHKRGHFDNPYNTRIFDFVLTWAEWAK